MFGVDGMKKRMSTGGMAVVEEMERYGVTHVFGLVGSSLLEIYDALFDSKQITYVGAMDERSAAFMADGWARVQRRVGVVMAGQSGPGVTNLVSGLACAKLGGSPVVAIGGAVSRDHSGRDAFQEVDQVRMLQAVTKAVIEVPTGARIREQIGYAFRLAEAEPRGPVYVNLPRDVLAELVDDAPERLHRPDTRPTELFPRSVDLDGVRHAAALLARSLHPVIVAGGGVVWSGASAEVAKLAEILNAPILTSAGHRDAVNNSNEWFVGQMGPRGSELAQEILAEADCVIGIGTRFGFNSSFFSTEVMSPEKRIIQVDSDSRMVGRYFSVDVGIVSDARAFCEQLMNLVSKDDGNLTSDRKAWGEKVKLKIADRRAERRIVPVAADSPLGPDEFFATIRAALPVDAIVTLDAGTWCLLASEALDHFRDPALITPLEFATLGFALPASIGAQLSAPERRCFALVGDGGVSFALNELVTAVNARAPITVIVMNNHAWGAEKAYQRDFFDERYIGTDLRPVRFDKVANSLGVRGLHAESVGELRECLEIVATFDGPAVIDCSVDATVMRSFRTDSFGHRDITQSLQQTVSVSEEAS